jgi:hypothetical protein
MTFAMRQSVMTARASKSASAPNSVSSMPNARLIIPLQNVPSKRRRLRRHQFARFMRPQLNGGTLCAGMDLIAFFARAWGGSSL